jgi:hypothetical protein
MGLYIFIGHGFPTGVGNLHDWGHYCTTKEPAIPLSEHIVVHNDLGSHCHKNGLRKNNELGPL